LQSVEIRAKASNLPLTFHGAKDHADEDLQNFKVFVNPSISDVVATTTAEALAMGKFVVCAAHPCNEYFSTFSNCITYRSSDEFAEKLEYALTHDPKPLSPAELSSLSWEHATERFLDAAQLTPLERCGRLEQVFDSVAAAAHNALTGVEAFRVNAGAGAHTMYSPQRVTDYIPCDKDHGGMLDNHARASSVRKQKRS
jgi:digalactosyldiacylglycerol synthase